MNKFIYKYKPEPLDDPQIAPFCGYISIPMNSIILSGAVVNGDVCIYALVDPTETAMVKILIAIIPTGAELTEEYYNKLFSETAHFVGTLVDESKTKSGSALVWHVWWAAVK